MSQDRKIAHEPGKSVTVTDESTAVVAVNRQRAELLITNDSDTDIYLRFAATGATVGEGVYLKASGGALTTTSYDGAVCAIHDDEGDKNLCVVEV